MSPPSPAIILDWLDPMDLLMCGSMQDDPVSDRIGTADNLTIDHVLKSSAEARPPLVANIQQHA